MTKVIYIAHKYGGEQDNANQAAEIIKGLVNEYPDYCFVSPIHSFGYLYDAVDYQKGMDYCLTLLDMSDEMWVYGTLSKGVRLEIDHADKHNIPIYYKWN